MGGFEVNQLHDGDTLVFQFEGTIDEDVKFPELAESPAHIRLDMKAIRSINSCGIREWVRWITPISEKNKVSLIHCPKVIVDQMNMVEGFLPEGAMVDSFYVPYFCEDLDQDHSILIERGREYEQAHGDKRGQIDIKETMRFDDFEGEFEIDVIESKYFKFLGV